MRCIASELDDISKIIYMQDFNNLSAANLASVKASMTTGTQYQLKDLRDNKTYYVSKLADGNVWMTQNLDLDLDSTKTYTSADTDVAANWTPSLSTYSSSINTWNDSYVVPESYDPGDLCWDGTVNSRGAINDYSSSCNQGGSHYHIGNYYNWAAAIAMNDSSGVSADIDINQSICPAGWRLPKGGSDTSTGSFVYLVNQQNLTVSNIYSDPAYFVYGGYWRGRSDLVSYYGRYWSSVTGSNYAYGLYLKNNSVQSQYSGLHRNWGGSIRCVAR